MSSRGKTRNLPVITLMGNQFLIIENEDDLQIAKPAIRAAMLYPICRRRVSWIVQTKIKPNLSALLEMYKKIAIGVRRYNNRPPFDVISLIGGPTKEDIVFSEVNLGRFFVGIGFMITPSPPRGATMSYGAIAYAVSPVYAIPEPRRFHPHVSVSCSICLGRGVDSFVKSARRNDLVSCLDIAKAVLSSYCAEDSYFPIGNWYGYSCADCGNIVANDERCCSCMVPICNRCAIINKDRHFCSACASHRGL
ncbi:MAG: hypothetical protein DRN26_00200 [Thermoplasmata archaeon]|nr:MAG: hypothetical protein DRN26_00200 [Thermoplasmata archaeon]